MTQTFDKGSGNNPPARQLTSCGDVSCELLVMSAGGYKFADFLRVGIPLTIIMWIGFSLVLPMLCQHCYQAPCESVCPAKVPYGEIIDRGKTLLLDGALAEALGIRQALVPVHAGVLSVLGMLAAPRGRQLLHSVPGLIEEQTDAQLTSRLQALAAQGRAELVEEGVKAAAITSDFSLDMRYRGQSYTLNIPYRAVHQALEDFHAAHQRRFGHRLQALRHLRRIVGSICGLRGQQLQDQPVEGLTDQLVFGGRLDAPRRDALVDRGDAFAQLGRDAVPGPAVHQLARLAAAREHDRWDVIGDERAEDATGLPHRARSDPPLGIVEFRIPQHIRLRALGRRVLVDHGNVQPADSSGQLTRVADCRRREHKRRMAPVVSADSTQPPQHLGDMAAEDAAKDVELKEVTRATFDREPLSYAPQVIVLLGQPALPVDGQPAAAVIRSYLAISSSCVSSWSGSWGMQSTGHTSTHCEVS